MDKGTGFSACSAVDAAHLIVDQACMRSRSAGTGRRTTNSIIASKSYMTKLHKLYFLGFNLTIAQKFLLIADAHVRQHGMQTVQV